MLKRIAPIAKAVTGTVIAGLGSLAVAVTDGVVTPEEWIGTAVVTLTASYAIWRIPNAEEPAENTDDAWQ